MVFKIVILTIYTIWCCHDLHIAPNFKIYAYFVIVRRQRLNEYFLMKQHFFCLLVILQIFGCSPENQINDIPDKLVVLTFDDAPASQYSVDGSPPTPGIWL